MAKMTDLFYEEAEADGQFVISYELICLLKWLTENDAALLKRLIKKSLSSGLHNRLKKAEEESKDHFNLEEAQQSILDFFTLLENIMMDVRNEQAVKKAVEKNLIPAIEHIDSAVCDDAMIRFSVEKASAKDNDDSKESPQELFFKEILKRWKPNKKNVLN